MFYPIFSKSKNSFEGQHSYENTAILTYRHWFVLFGRLLIFVILFFLPILISIFGGLYIARFGLVSIFNFVATVYYILWWSGLFYTITMYLLDTWVVTDHRILDNEQHGFFNRTLSETNLSKVQDLSVKVDGLIPTFFDYGDLEIQTSGTIPKITFKQIPHPNAVKAEISQIINSFTITHKDGVEIHEKTELQ